MTRENKDVLRKRDLLTAYYDLDYLHNPKGSNYWRNRYVNHNQLGNMFFTVLLFALYLFVVFVYIVCRVLKVASKFSSQGLLFSVANRNDFMEELEEEFGLSTSDGSELPFITIRTRTGDKYTMREEFT